MAITAEPASTNPPRSEPETSHGRQTCYDCFRPRAYCYCALIPRIDNRTRITVLQHPRERFHPIGTARIARLALSNCELVVDYDRCFSSGRQHLELPPDAGLLYPAAPSRALEELAPHERPKHLVLLDGTWHHARYMFRDVPGLADLPRYHLGAPEPSRYRLRKEPQRDFVSTVEAVVYCLQALEPETPGVAELLRVFDVMIDRQIAARDSAGQRRPMTRRRPKPLRSFPTAFAENFGDLVVGYGEAPLGELVQWTAHRLSDGATFERLIRPSRPLDPYFLEHLELSTTELEAGVDMGSFIHDWSHFVRPRDVLAAWNQATLIPLTRALGALGPTAYLKAAYRGLSRHGGALDAVVRAERLRAPRVECRGRAAQRLSNAVALARLLGELARDRGS